MSAQLKVKVKLRRDAWRLEWDGHIPGSGVTGVFGPSGSGKTSLLRCLAGLEPATGSIHFKKQCWLNADRSLPPEKRGIAMVSQGEQLFPHLTVAENIEWAWRRRVSHTGERPEEIMRWLELSHLATRKPAALSGGESQRVALARALARAPQLLLLDEPLSGLHDSARQTLMGILEITALGSQCPILYVSHNWSELARLAGHVLVMEQGRVIKSGDLISLSSDLSNPVNRGREAGAVLLAKVAEHDGAYALTRVVITQGVELWVPRQRYAIGSELRLQIPARDVSLSLSRAKDSSILNILPCTIAALMADDDGKVMVQLALSGQRLLASVTLRSAERLKLKVGDRVFAQIKSVALLSESGDN